MVKNMNIMLISEYINRITKKDIINYSLKQNIVLEEKEIDILYKYIKEEYINFINNPEKILNNLKKEISKNTYNLIYELYFKYKEKINKIKNKNYL